MENKIYSKDEFYEKLKLMGKIPTEQQKAAIEHLDGNCLIVAVPGSGKTMTIECRVAYLYACHGVDPSSVLAITYTRNAAKEMQKRCEDALKAFGYDGSVHISTIHSLAVGIVRAAYGNVRVLDYKAPYICNRTKKEYKGNRFEIMKGFLETIFTSETIFKGSDFDYIYADMNYCRSIDLDFDDEISTGRRNVSENIRYDLGMLQLILKEYQAYKHRNNVIDFLDMIILAKKALNDFPRLSAHYHDRFRYIMLDEAQDTTQIQADFITELLPSSINHNIYIVGDDDQTIYGFNGADPRILMQYQERFNCTLLKLEENFRSSKEIVAVSNNIRSVNPFQIPKTIFTNNKNKTAVSVYQYSDYYEQIKALPYIASEMAKKYGEVAILYRLNMSAIGASVSLTMKGLDFVSGTVFKYDDAYEFIGDIKKILLFAVSPQSFERFSEVYYMMGLNFKKELLDFYNPNNSGDVIDKLLVDRRVNDYYRMALKQMKAEMYVMANYTAREIMNTIKNIFIRSNYISAQNLYLKSIDLIAEKSRDIRDFLSNLSKVQAKMKQTNSQSNIILNTIHGAKGLEYKSVILIDVYNGSLPCVQCKNGNIVDMDTLRMYEERRIFYVGVTRAKTKLCILTSNHISDEFSTSRFIYEMLNKNDNERVEENACY